MLTDILDAIIYASDKDEVEARYKELEKLGVDRHTAGVMVRVRVEELFEEGRKEVT